MKGRQYLRLVGYECRKAFFNPGMVIFFVVLLLFNGWKIRDSYERKVAEWTDYEPQYTETYEKYSGIITAEKISDLMTVYAPLEAKKNTFTLNYNYDPNAYIYSEAVDERFYCTLFYTELKYDYLYRNEAHRITENALEMAKFYEGVGNDFEAAKNRRIAQTFTGRSISAFYDTRGYEVLLNYDYSAMLILLLSIFALCGVFVNERETDMYMLLRTTKNGSGSTVAAKLTAAGLFVLVVCTTFFAQDFLSIYFASPRNEALQSPVYALRALESTPLDMTVGQFFLWAAVVKTLGILACCTMLLLISSILKNTLGAFFTSLALLLGCVVLQEFNQGNVILRWCNPVELIIPRELIWRDVYVNIFGMPVRLYVFVLTGVAIAVAAMICGILYLNRSYHNRAGRRGGAMVRFEWKKLLFYRKGLVLIAVFLIAELIGTILFTKPYDKDLEANRAVYDRYLSQVEGPLTPDNRQWLEDEMLRLNTANTKLEQLKSDYYQGRITEDAFRTSFDVLAAENADYPGFSKLYTQYIYVRESDQRNFLYTGGWEVLFGNQEPDYLFLLLLIFLIAPIFCQEYGNQMDQILLTQKRSAKFQWRTKVTIALLATAVLTAILQLFELTYCAIQFGLPHWDYSLQSLYSFGSAQKELTLGQAFFLQFILKEIGYLYVALLILCISVLVKKYAFALMAGMVILPIPFLTVNSNASLCLIPGPWALTIGSIYLNGDSFQLSGGAVVPAPEVTWAELGKVLVLSVVICLCMLLCIWHKNTNYHLRIRGHKTVAALLTIMLLCTGCGGQAESIYYNSKQSNCFESEQYIVFADGMGGCYFIDKQKDIVHDFPLDAFQGETAKVKGSFYSADGKLYYLKAQQQALTGNAETMTEYFSLVELHIDTMQECVAYQWSQDTKWFFGLLDKDSTEPSPYYIDSFFLHEGELYYPNNGELYVMNLQSGRYETYLKLPNPGTNLAYDGANIYYTDQYNRLSIHNLRTGSTEALESVVARDFVWTPDGIYFLNIRDSNTLYYWNEATQTAQKLDDTEAYALYWDENYCWIDSMDGLFRLNHDGSNKTKVDCPGFVCCIITGAAMYISDYENGILYSVNKDTLQHTKLTQ